MRTKVFLNFILAFGVVLGGIDAETKSKSDEADGFAIFNDLSKEDALKQGQEMARHNFAKGVYRLLVVGKRPVKSAYDEYLKVNYGILVTPIAGCIVSRGIVGGEEGYNLTMKPLLNRKFGHDIFKEADEVTRSSGSSTGAGGRRSAGPNDAT